MASQFNHTAITSHFRNPKPRIRTRILFSSASSIPPPTRVSRESRSWGLGSDMSRLLPIQHFGVLSPYQFSRRALGSDDVSIKITYCGVCYADVIWTRNLHQDSKYPVVPGNLWRKKKMSGGSGAGECSVVWFRRDLRVEDNPALAAGVRAGTVVAVFIWAPEEEGHYQPGRVSRWWLKHSLANLDYSLRSLGTSLITKRATDNVSSLLEIVKSTVPLSFSLTIYMIP